MQNIIIHMCSVYDLYLAIIGLAMTLDYRKSSNYSANQKNNSELRFAPQLER